MADTHFCIDIWFLNFSTGISKNVFNSLRYWGMTSEAVGRTVTISVLREFKINIICRVHGIHHRTRCLPLETIQFGAAQDAVIRRIETAAS